MVTQVNQSQPGRLRWLLIVWMFLISAVAYLDRVNISIAGSSIAREFHLDNVHLGWIFSSFLVGYALFQAPGGALADKIGPRKVLGLGVIWWAIFTCLITALSPSVGGLLLVLMLVRFSLGMGEAVVYPASNTTVSSWIPSTERGMANGIIFSGVGIGGAFTSPFVGYLMVNYGWRSCFWASAVLGLVVGAVWYVIARDKPQDHPWISAGELKYIEEGLPYTTGKKGTAQKLPWSLILRDANIWAVTFSYFAYGYAAYIFISWFFIYLNTARHLDVKQSTLFTTLPFLAMALGSLIGGWISDRLTISRGKRVGRCYFAAAAITVCAVFIVLGTMVESAQVASVVLAGGAGALYLSQSSFWSISADIGKGSAGSVSGFMNMACQFGGAITASLTPWIAKHYGWTASFLVAAALCVAGAVAWLPVKPEVATKRTPVAV